MIELQLASIRRPARGNVDRSGRLTVACRFEEPTFEAISALCQTTRKSFAQVVRELTSEALAARASKPV
jgi:hypothetical protein